MHANMDVVVRSGLCLSSKNIAQLFLPPTYMNKIENKSVFYKVCIGLNFALNFFSFCHSIEFLLQNQTSEEISFLAKSYKEDQDTVLHFVFSFP